MPKSYEKAVPNPKPSIWESSSSSSSINDYDLLESEIERMESGTFRWLRHPSPLEEHFEAASSQVRSRRIWIEGIFCVALFNGFLLVDYLLSPNNFSHFLIVRLGFATPPAILVLIFLRRGVSKVVREGMVVAVFAIFALSLLYLYSDMSAVASSYSVATLAILLLFTNIGLRIRLMYAIAASGVCVAFALVYLSMDAMLKVPEKVEGVALLLSAIALSLIGNYSIERSERLNFLLRLRRDREYGVLTNANDALLRISYEDRLTGVANRRHFDSFYKGIWKTCVASKSPLLVIMIDIDNFKALNDLYGHPYGDAVLRRVAALLKHCLRMEGDFLARYGGEEFIVVLPDSSTEAASHVAQRIRLLIEVAGSPAVNRRTTDGHGWSTVSCGVASTFPIKEMDLNDLIAQADKALYQAKMQGRNRVCFAEETQVDPAS
jgi:diguanylate cyclase (GGDEF)-like protein